jgi:hypothetical protein
LIEKPAITLGISMDLSGMKNKKRMISKNNIGNFFIGGNIN